MSKISDALDELLADVKTLFPDKTHIADSFNLPNNTDGSLKDGFAFRFDTGVNTKRQVGCKSSKERNIVIILTKRTFVSDLKSDERRDAEKVLLEDFTVLVNKYEKEPQLLDGGVSKFVYSDDNGIENVRPDSAQFIKIEIVFKMEYFENL